MKKNRRSDKDEKQPRKLTLNRESLRRLNADELRAAIGANEGKTCYSTFTGTTCVGG